jgi:hypothetical protein
MTDPSGPAPVPASRGRRLVSPLAPTIRAIFGMAGSGSYDSATLSRCLVNRLRARLHGRGSTVFALTWSTSTTPSGRSICRLRASARSTLDSGSGSWPSPVVNDAKWSDYSYSQGNHDKPALKLGGVAKLAIWATPAARDWKSNEAGPAHHAARRGQTRGKPLIRAGASTGELAHADGRQSGDGHVQRSGEHGQRPAHGAVSWEDAEWIACTDGKARPVEPGTFPLAHGIPARVGRLRGYGNAIVPQVAAAFIEAYLSIEQPGCEREDPGDGISNTVPNA